MTHLTTTPFEPRATAQDVLAGVDLHGKRMLVTGGASGLGLETTRALAGAGAEVVVAARSVSRAEDALRTAGIHEDIGVVELDLGDLASVSALTDAWTGPLDALIANAGIMAVPTLEHTASGWEKHLATNFLGHFALATGLHAALRSAGAARVVTVSSGAHRGHPVDLDDPHFLRTDYDKWQAYGRSKSADVLLAVGIAQRWHGDGITANAMSPGWVHTDLQRHMSPAELQAMGAADAEGNAITPSYYKTPAQGAATSVLLAASPLVAEVTGRHFEDNQESPVTPDGTGDGVAAHALDAASSNRLWELAEAAIAVK